MKTTKSLLLLSVLLLFTAGTYAQQVGETAPDFSVTTASGSSFSLAEEAGNLVVLFFFGNSCPSCIGIAPTVEENIYQVYNTNPNFTMLGLDTWDNSSSVSSVNVFKSGTGVTFDLVVKAGNIASLFETTYDRILVIDADGVLVYKGSQNISGDISNVISAIDEHLPSGATSVSNTRLNFISNAYPNPASGVVNFSVNLSQSAVITVELSEVTGKTAQIHTFKRKSPGAHNLEFSLNGLNQGLYIYTIKTESGKQSEGKLFVK